jgi:DNA polymerase-1
MELSGYECLKPKQVMEFKMLFGDTSDNYKGPLGEKMAKTLLSQYGNIDNIYSHLEELKPAIQTKIKQFCNDEMENGMTCREFAYFMAHIFTTVENIDKNIDSYFKKPVDMFELQNFINDNKFSGFDKYIKKIK